MAKSKAKKAKKRAREKPKPKNKKLWNKLKAEAKKKFKVYPSAYANAWLTKEYKRKGGQFTGSRARGGLTKWFGEEWVAVSAKGARRNPPTRQCRGTTKAGRRCRRNSSHPRQNPTHCPSHKSQCKTRNSRGRRTRTRARRNPDCNWTHVKFSRSERGGKKLKALFTQSGSNRKKTTHFGATGYSDYTMHKNKDRRAKYIARHKARENWSKCDSAGALSRWVLWGETTSLAGAQAAFRRKFDLKSGIAKS